MFTSLKFRYMMRGQDPELDSELEPAYHSAIETLAEREHDPELEPAYHSAVVHDMIGNLIENLIENFAGKIVYCVLF